MVDNAKVGGLVGHRSSSITAFAKHPVNFLGNPLKRSLFAKPDNCVDFEYTFLQFARSGLDLSCK